MYNKIRCEKWYYDLREMSKTENPSGEEIAQTPTAGTKAEENNMALIINESIDQYVMVLRKLAQKQATTRSLGTCMAFRSGQKYEKCKLV